MAFGFHKPDSIRALIDSTIVYNGERWRISEIGGIRDEHGRRYVVLCHPTRGYQARNGWHPQTTADWINLNG